MAFFFNKHPEIQYDVLQNGVPSKAQNPLVRFKIKEIIKDRTALYYTHDMQEGQSVQFIAQKYHGDANLDWLIFLINDIIDPLFDLPLDYQEFTSYVRSKYGSIESAMNGVHHYEQIIQQQSLNFDGTPIPEKVVVIDETTYGTLTPTSRRSVSNYTYEEEHNEKKRTIKILHNNYLTQVLDEAERIFE